MNVRSAARTDARAMSAMLRRLVSAGKRASPADEDYVLATYIANPHGVACSIAQDRDGGIQGFQSFVEENDVWLKIDERLTRKFAITGHLETPAKVIAHSLADVDDKLARGLPFFVDIARDGIRLYETAGHALAEPKPLTPQAARQEAQKHFDQWFQLSTDVLKVA